MFNEIALKPSYYTTSSNIVNEFYNPVLEIATSYDRVSGYFSSKALAAYAKGLKGLVQNGGKMRLIISQDISEEDFELIKLGYNLREQLLNNLFSKLDEPLTNDEQMNFCNLAHLIAKEKVDFKIGFKTLGLFHSKFGLCEDKEGNIIYFTGSNNETNAAIEKNFESFDITASWLSSDFDKQKLVRARQEFETLWEDKAQTMCVYVKEINEVIKKKIMSFDRGRLILNTDMLTDDALVLSIDDDKLFLEDTLTSYVIKGKDYALQKLTPYLENAYPNFKSDLSYMDMNEIIKIFERFASRKKFRFIVSKELEHYLEQQAYWIEERSKYAILLKCQDEQIVDRFIEFQQIVSVELDRKLREKQMWSAFYMQQMKKAANFSVPGAGKTSMIYGVFAYLNSPQINKIDKIIMIGPKNSFLAWKQEFKANFGDKKELKLLDIHDEESPSIQLEINSSNKNLILINYESLQKYESILSEIIDDRTMLVFDEIHKIKGVRSKRAQVAKKIAEKPLFKFVLTGTPIPNTYEDIFNFLNILYTDEYKKFFNFKINELKNPDVLKIKKINDKLYPFFWRTTKMDLQVPPANTDEIIKVPTDTLEQEIIDLLYKKYGNDAFNLYIRLIQAASNPELLLKTISRIEMYGEEDNTSWYNNFEKDDVVFTDEEIEIIRQVSTTSKYKAAIELVINLKNEGKQCLVWCMFVNTIDKVYNDLKSKGVKVAVIYGSTHQKEREEIIEAFKREEIEVLITNPHTLAESVSLHRTCHDAIYLEYSFNLTHMLQSRDRIHRLGLKDDDYTQYYYFMLEGQNERQNTIDERIYYRLKEKEQRMINAIENGILEPDPEVDYEEILNLFKI
ncbi:SNF2-related protein [Gottfriedia sp. NPDC058432]|uniref:SNF2-related protein n=1 Tax=Gottfriedia sp. NPDC058432 TaxID=3346497 RepID=UPI00364773BD